MLYWFRTPPNIKVGRDPFDAEIRRALEAQYPGVSFDWQKIVETPIPSAEAERWRERRRLERAARAVRQAAEGEVEPEIDAEEEAAEAAEPSDEDVSVDAAERQADALAPTEESLLSTAATIETPTPATGTLDMPVEPAEVAPLLSAPGPAEPHRSRRRRRRRRRGRDGGEPH